VRRNIFVPRLWPFGFGTRIKNVHKVSGTEFNFHFSLDACDWRNFSLLKIIAQCKLWADVTRRSRKIIFHWWRAKSRAQVKLP
jgi:hypothetical protein